jgi:hypothetical protein
MIRMGWDALETKYEDSMNMVCVRSKQYSGLQEPYNDELLLPNHHQPINIPIHRAEAVFMNMNT